MPWLATDKDGATYAYWGGRPTRDVEVWSNFTREGVQLNYSQITYECKYNLIGEQDWEDDPIFVKEEFTYNERVQREVEEESSRLHEYHARFNLYNGYGGGLTELDILELRLNKTKHVEERNDIMSKIINIRNGNSVNRGI